MISRSGRAENSARVRSAVRRILRRRYETARFLEWYGSRCVASGTETITSSGSLCCRSMCASRRLTCALRPAVGMMTTSFIDHPLSRSFLLPVVTASLAGRILGTPLKLNAELLARSPRLSLSRRCTYVGGRGPDDRRRTYGTGTKGEDLRRWT